MEMFYSPYFWNFWRKLALKAPQDKGLENVD